MGSATCYGLFGCGAVGKLAQTRPESLVQTKEPISKTQLNFPTIAFVDSNLVSVKAQAGWSIATP